MLGRGLEKYNTPLAEAVLQTPTTCLLKTESYVTFSEAGDLHLWGWGVWGERAPCERKRVQRSVEAR